MDGVRAEINRLADGYDYDAAIKLAKKDSAEQLNQMASGLEEEKGQVSAWEEPNNIPHLFFHSLIVDPGRAFDEGSSSQGYADYMVTQKEFAAILDELYARDYVLVNPEDFASLDEQGQMEYRDIMLPQGKKPVVLSIDDLSYYEYMEGDGFASKLVLDKDGKVRNEYVDAEGKTQVGAFDVTTMVDDFIAEHPDFTYRDARGLIAMTGYNGAFGYRTSASQYPQSKTLEADQKKAAEIAEAMKNSGWVFASHSWGHIATGTVSMDRLKRDTKLWKAEVEPIVGKTGHYIYPFGSDIARIQRYAGERYQFFKDQGFDYFYGVDGTTRTWMQQGDEYQRQMRINVDGLQFAKELRGDRPVLGSFFKVEDVIDPARE
ncbi:hypothetical protein EDF61_101567 [Arthrobacter sp. JUb115]|nr:hypothetical protein EDF61_101567 [Arthrobacter sp. JUb115]